MTTEVCKGDLISMKRLLAVYAGLKLCYKIYTHTDIINGCQLIVYVFIFKMLLNNFKIKYKVNYGTIKKKIYLLNDKLLKINTGHYFTIGRFS